MEAVCSSEALVSTYKSTRHYIPEDQRDIFTALRTSNLQLMCVGPYVISCMHLVVVKETLGNRSVELLFTNMMPL
jgi:hypothetical protein